MSARGSHRLLVAALILCVTVAPLHRALAAPDPLAELARARAHLAAGDAASAARLAGAVARDATLGRADRGEANLVYGLALLALGLADEADATLFQYLVLHPDAHLEPTLYSPETVLFLEQVRERHAAALRRLRPRPVKRRHAALSLLPPAGQFQNGDRRKGIALGVIEFLLAATNVATYALLNDRCTEADGLCGTAPGEPPDDARTLQRVNLLSGSLLAGVIGYGIIDAFAGHRRLDAAERATITVAVVPRELAVVGWSIPF